MRQGRVGNGGHRAFSEVVVIEPEDPRVGAEPQFVRTMAPCQIVVDENPSGATALDPGVVQSAERGEGSVRSDTLQNNWKCGQRLLKVAGAKQTLVPGESGVEVVHQVLGKDVRIACGKGIQRLRRNRVEQGIDRIGVGGLQAGVGLKTKPGRIVGTDVVVDARRLHLLMVVAGMRDALTVGAAIPVGWIASRRRFHPTLKGQPSTARGIPFVFW